MKKIMTNKTMAIQKRQEKQHTCECVYVCIYIKMNM